MKRIYLKPGDIVTALVDLVVIKRKDVDMLNYDLHHVGSNTEIKFFSDEIKNDERDYGYIVKYAWDLNPKNEHYGRPYYEEKDK